MSMMYNPQIQRMLADEKAKAKKPRATGIFGPLPVGAESNGAAEAQASLARPPILANQSSPYVVGTPGPKGAQPNLAASVAAQTPARPAPEPQPPLVAGAPVYGPASLAPTRPARPCLPGSALPIQRLPQRGSVKRLAGRPTDCYLCTSDLQKMVAGCPLVWSQTVGRRGCRNRHGPAHSPEPIPLQVSRVPDSAARL